MTRAAFGWRRSSGSACLPRLRETKWRVSPGASCASCRTGSPSSASTLMTCAPPSASTWAQKGTAMN